MTESSVTHLQKKNSRLYHNCMAVSFKKFISTVAHLIKYRILSLAKNLYLNVYLLHGREKYSRSELTILFLGDKISLSYLSSIIYEEEPKKNPLGKVFIFNIRKKINHFSSKVDMIFVETDRGFSKFLIKKGFVIIPEWIEMKLDISRPLEKIYERFTSSAKKDIQTIKKYDYSYEISTDPNKLDFFYHEMCVPYMSSRYGKMLVPDALDYHDVKRNFENGMLLLIKEKDKYIAGSVISIHGKTAYPVYLGIVEDSYYLKRGAGAALYYFPIVWAKENGMNLLEFGNTRTFLNDGSFQYKRKWGMTVNKSKIFFEIFGLKICNYNVKTVQSFLENNPFICIDKNQLKGIVFLQQQVICNDIQQLWKKYYTSGLSKLSIISTRNFNKDVKSFVSSNYNGKIVLKENLIT